MFCTYGINTIFFFFLQTSEDEFRPPLKKRKVGRPRKYPSPFDEAIKKHQSLNQKKDKPTPLSSNLINSVTTIKTTQIDTSSSGQYKIKPKLKAEVKVSWFYNHFGIT